MSTSNETKVTVGKYLDWLLPGVLQRKTAPPWPPDVFALAASLLHRSGAYTSIVQKRLGSPKWVDEICDVGAEWRKSFRNKVPDRVDEWWSILRSKKNVPIRQVREDDALTNALLRLACAADEASEGIGLVGPFAADAEDFESAWADAMEGEGRTCCIDVSPDRAVVLPKLHTPRSGMTLRSLTHNLALYQPGEVIPRWHNMPSFDGAENLNLLLLPWPLEIDSKAVFEACGTSIDMPGRFGFFSCDVRGTKRSIIDDVRAALAAAEKRARIDAIVFPEGCLIGDEYIEISRTTNKLVIGGVATPANKGVSGLNQAAVAIPAGTYQLTWKQSKHHRWRIDGSQIDQYSLSLDKSREWWEDIQIEQRQINFLSTNDWLTLTVLICEDLARLDPVADLVRSVGPSLVVCLLLDGPQLPTRWPARYATVLADDPGSSVLTLTCAGMARISRPSGKSKAGTDSKTVVALWKDGKSSAVPIELKKGSAGVILKLRREYFEEWSADGRSDGNTTAYLLYDEHEQVRLGA